MRASFSPGYSIPLPQGHRFPMPKFRLLFELLVKQGLLDRQDVFEPAEAAWDDLRLVHTDAYLRDLRDGSLDRKAERRMGLPWSPALVRRSRLAVAGTIAAGPIPRPPPVTIAILPSSWPMVSSFLEARTHTRDELPLRLPFETSIQKRINV